MKQKQLYVPKGCRKLSPPVTKLDLTDRERRENTAKPKQSTAIRGFLAFGSLGSGLL